MEGFVAPIVEVNILAGSTQRAKENALLHIVHFAKSRLSWSHTAFLKEISVPILAVVNMDFFLAGLPVLERK
jgi:hypothetical protein